MPTRASKGRGYVREVASRHRFEAILVVAGTKHTRTVSYRAGDQRDRSRAKRLAETRLAQLSEQHLRGVSLERVTVTAYLKQWLDLVSGSDLAANTRRNYESVTRVHLIPALGQIYLDRLNADDVDALLARLRRGGMKPSTLGKVRRVAHRAFDHAEKRGRIARNPVALTEAQRIPNIERRTLSPTEAAAFLESVSGHRLEALWNIAACLGLRSGEVRGLRWDDVRANGLRIEHSLTWTKQGYHLAPTKDRELRLVPLPAFISELLERRREQQRFEAKHTRLNATDDHLELWDNPLGLVFTGYLGTPLSAWGVTKGLHRLLGEAKLPDVTFHDLRHCATSLMLARGVPPRMVQEVLGHASPSMTLGRYAHVDSAQREEAAAALDAWRELGR